MVDEISPEVISKAKHLARDRSIVVSTNLGNVRSDQFASDNAFAEANWQMFVETARRHLKKAAKDGIDPALDDFHLLEKLNLIARLSVPYHYIAPSDVELVRSLFTNYVNHEIKSKNFDYPLQIKYDVPSWLETVQAKSIYVEGMEINYPGVDPRMILLGMQDSPNSHLYKTEAYGNTLVRTPSPMNNAVNLLLKSLGIVYIVTLTIDNISKLF